MYPDEYLNKENDQAILFFSSPFDPLNNWSAHQVKIWGKIFATAEHAYQFKKFDMTSEDIAQRIFRAPSPSEAHRLAQEYKAQVREDWPSLKRSVMTEIIRAKTEQHADVRAQLKKTGTRQIAENSPWGSYWGCGKDAMGENVLGQIWMEIRKELA